MQSLEKIVLCAPAVGATMWCLFLSVMLQSNPQIFHAPCRKNYRKMTGTFLMVSTPSYHHAKFGEDCTMRAGCSCENVVLFFSVTLQSCTLCVRGVHTSNKYCVTVYALILMQFSPFLEGILSDAVHSSHFRRWMAPQIPQNIGQKL